MASIKEVAKLAGVSIATVSRYLNNPEQVKDATRERYKLRSHKPDTLPIVWREISVAEKPELYSSCSPPLAHHFLKG